MSDLFAFGIGHATHNRAGVPLEVLFPAPCKQPFGRDRCSGSCAPEAGRQQLCLLQTQLRSPDRLPNVGAADAARGCELLAEIDKPLTGLVLEHDGAIQSTAEAYFKLQLLSHRLALPNTLNLDGIFAQLPNVAWTSDGAIDVSEIRRPR